MGWDDAPPTKNELATNLRLGQSWDMDPPKPEELAPPDQEKPWYDVSAKGLMKGAVRALPMAGGVAGGVAGAFAGGLPATGGAALGAAGGKALENYIEANFMGQPKTRDEIWVDPLKEGALSGVAEGTGQVLVKGVGLLGKAASKFVQPAKESAPEILAAGERLGVKPTRGMLTSNPAVQNLESSLSQSPTYAGRQTSEPIDAIQKKLSSNAQEILKPGTVKGLGTESLSSYQTGAEASSGIVSKAAERVAPAQMVYQDLEQYAPHIDIKEGSKKAIANNIRNHPMATAVKGSPASQMANQIADSVDGLQSLDQLRTLKSYVGKSMDAAQGKPEYGVLADSYGKLSKLEQTSITRSAVESARTTGEGQKLASEMVSNIKGANKVYSQAMTEFKQAASDWKLGKFGGPQGFAKKVESIPNEKLADKIFDPENYDSLVRMQKQFPDSFEALRKGKLADLWDKAKSGDKVDPTKLVKLANQLTPEAKNLIFGKETTQTLKDMETMITNFPKKVGASDTPRGMEWGSHELLNPASWPNELSRMSQKFRLENPQLGQKLQKASGIMKKTGFMQPVGRGLLLPLRQDDEPTPFNQSPVDVNFGRNNK